MTALIRKPWTKQPLAGTPIDKAHPLAGSCIFAFLPDVGGGIDSVTGKRGVLTQVNASPYPSHSGLHGNVLTSLVDNGATSYGYLNFPGATIRGNGASAFAVIRRGPNIEPYWSTLIEFSAAAGFDAQWQGGTDTAVTAQYGSIYESTGGVSSSSQSGTLADWTNKEWRSQGFTWPYGTSSAVDHYENGQLLAFNTGTPDFDQRSWTRINLCGSASWPTESWSGDMAVALMFDRQLTAAEHASLHENPWQIFAPQKVFIPPKPNRKLVRF
jgi:hypothetical protein